MSFASFDLDSETPIFNRYDSNAKFFDISVQSEIDMLLTALANQNESTTIIDMGPGSRSKLKPWLETLSVDSSLSSAITIISCINHSRASSANLRNWHEEILYRFPSLEYVIARNLVNGPTSFYSTSEFRKLYNHNLRAVEIEIPKLNHFVQTELDKNKIGIEAALQCAGSRDGFTKFLPRLRLWRYRQAVFAQFTTIQKYLLI